MLKHITSNFSLQTALIFGNAFLFTFGDNFCISIHSSILAADIHVRLHKIWSRFCTLWYGSSPSLLSRLIWHSFIAQVILMRTDSNLCRKELTVHWSAPYSHIRSYFQPCTNSMWLDESEAVAPIIWLYQIVDAQKEEVFFPDLITLRSYDLVYCTYAVWLCRQCDFGFLCMHSILKTKTSILSIDIIQLHWIRFWTIVAG